MQLSDRKIAIAPCNVKIAKRIYPPAVSHDVEHADREFREGNNYDHLMAIILFQDIVSRISMQLVRFEFHVVR